MSRPEQPPASGIWLTLATFVSGTVAGVVASAWWNRRFSAQPSSAILSNAGAESHLWKIVEYSMTAALIRAGDQLDLYRKLHDWGLLTSVDLALRTGWSERWLREFLLQATAAGLVTYQYGKFGMRHDYAALLKGPGESKTSLIGMFQFLSALVRRHDAVVQAIQTGIGVDYDFGEQDVCTAIERKNQNFFKYRLVEDMFSQVVVPSTQLKLVDMLEVGCKVADVGCGCGTSAIVMAKRFPNSHIWAFESSPRSLAAIRDNMKQEGVTNITVCDVADRLVGDGPDLQDTRSKFDFVYAHDVLHDMTHPQALIKDVKKRLSTEGCWVIVDVDCDETAEENLKRPSAPTHYAFSCLLCLSMATSVPSGQGLGTCGFSPELARKWTTGAGFQHFQQFKCRSLPNNACYLVA